MQVVKELDKLPGVERPGQHVPVPVAVVVVQVHVKELVRAGQHRHRLSGPLPGQQRVADVEGHAQVLGADRLAKGQRLAGRGQQTTYPRIVPLVLDRDAHVPVVGADGAERLLGEAIGIEIVGLEHVIVPVVQRTGRNAWRADFLGQVHRSLEIVHHLGALCRVGRGKRAAQPLARAPRAHVYRRHAVPIIVQQRFEQRHVGKVGRIAQL